MLVRAQGPQSVKLRNLLTETSFEKSLDRLKFRGATLVVNFTTNSLSLLSSEQSEIIKSVNLRGRRATRISISRTNPVAGLINGTTDDPFHRNRSMAIGFYRGIPLLLEWHVYVHRQVRVYSVACQLLVSASKILAAWVFTLDRVFQSSAAVIGREQQT